MPRDRCKPSCPTPASRPGEFENAQPTSRKAAVPLVEWHPRPVTVRHSPVTAALTNRGRCTYDISTHGWTFLALGFVGSTTGGICDSAIPERSVMSPRRDEAGPPDVQRGRHRRGFKGGYSPSPGRRFGRYFDHPTSFRFLFFPSQVAVDGDRYGPGKETISLLAIRSVTCSLALGFSDGYRNVSTRTRRLIEKSVRKPGNSRYYC